MGEGRLGHKPAVGFGAMLPEGEEGEGDPRAPWLLEWGKNLRNVAF